VLLIAQQHGDEMETSDSAINLARTLANNSVESRIIRNALTVVIMPRVNVDGFDGVKADGTPITDSQGRVPPWRQNYDPRFVTGSVPAFYQRGRGYDINRYHAFRPGCPLDNPNFPNLTTGVTSCENEVPGPDYTLADIGRGNPVPEARNVRIGAHTAMAGCAAVAGSARIGRHCLVGGGAGILGHLEICDRVVITAMSLVTHSIREPGEYSSGTPLMDNRSWRKSAARFKQLDRIARRSPGEAKDTE